MDNTRTIINLSTRKYWRGLQRLQNSVASQNVKFLYWRSEDQVGALPHKLNNYSFKPLCFKKAYDYGYRIILWLDASMLVIKDLTPIFDIIEKDGYFFQDSGWTNERWCPDNVKEYFGTNDGEMLSSGVLGLNLSSEIGFSFYSQWLQAMEDGMFNGSWDTHRHDQTCASIIAHKMGMKLQDGNSFFVYGKIGNEHITDKTLILADGIC